MSSGLDTVTRRQIRKAFGVDALKVIEAHELGLRGHSQILERLEAGINDERTHLLNLADEQRAYVDRADKQTDLKVNRFIGRTFWQRLRWLVRGT